MCGGQGETAQAAAAVRSAVELAPQDPRLKVLLASMLRQGDGGEGGAEEAVELLRQAAQLDPMVGPAPTRFV